MKKRTAERSTGRPKRDEYQKISVTLDVPLCERLAREVERLKTSRSRLVERMLEDYFFNFKRNRFAPLEAKITLTRRVVEEDDEALERSLVKLYRRSGNAKEGRR